MKSVIIGAGTYGQVYYAYLQDMGVNVIGFLDDNEKLWNTLVLGIPVLGGTDLLEKQRNTGMFEAVYCPIGNNRLRVHFLKCAEQLGYEIPNYIHSTVTLSPRVKIGKGVYILLGTTIMPYTQIDDYVMINDTNKGYDERFNDVDKASITVSFCKTHDELLFEDIEKDGCKEYTQTEIQNLEYALKAITFEIYDIAFEIDYLAELVKENVDVVYDSPNYSRYFEDYEIKLSLMEPYLELANRLIYDIKQMKESGVSSKIVTKYISLKYNRVEYSLSEIIDGCLVNVINASKPYIIISFYPDKKYGDQEICELVENYLKKPERKNLKRITEHIISNSKNIYFNKKIIEHLNKKALSNLYWAHRNGIGDNRVSNNFGDIMMKVFYK